MGTATERHLLSAKALQQTIAQLAAAIHERVGAEGELVLIGIQTRGVPLAQRLAEAIEALNGRRLPIGILDINLYRDDLSEVAHQPIVHRTELPFPVAGKGVILVDDVLYTGRTARAALDALVDFGRPRFVQLAVLIDRGFRELPIQADYVGKAVKTTVQENVKVMITPVDPRDEVLIQQQGGA